MRRWKLSKSSKKLIKEIEENTNYVVDGYYREFLPVYIEQCKEMLIDVELHAYKRGWKDGVKTQKDLR